MPRYHFHVQHGLNCTDPKGTELPDDLAAKGHASAYAKSIRQFHPNRRTVIKVTNSDGEELFQVPLHQDEGR